MIHSMESALLVEHLIEKRNKFVGEAFGPPNVRVVFAGAAEDSHEREDRVILLIGPSSADKEKAACIDAFCNFFYDVKKEDKFRYYIANEKFDGSTPNKAIITYVFNDTKMSFRPIVVDVKDDDVKLLHKWLSENSRLRIDIVCVVFNVIGRIDTEEEHNLKEMLSLFPKRIRTSTCVLLTNSDGNPPPIPLLRRFELHEFPVFKLNWSTLFTDTQDDSLKEYLRTNYWKMSEISLQAMISHIDTLHPQTFNGLPHEPPCFALHLKADNMSSSTSASTSTSTFVEKRTSTVTTSHHSSHHYDVPPAIDSPPLVKTTIFQTSTRHVEDKIIDKPVGIPQELLKQIEERSRSPDGREGKVVVQKTITVKMMKKDDEDEERRREEEERKRKEEEERKRKEEDEKKRKEEEEKKRKEEEDKKRIEEEKKRIEEEKRRIHLLEVEKKRKEEEEKRRIEEEKRRILLLEVERKKREEEERRRNEEEERKRREEEERRRRDEEERKRKEEEERRRILLIEVERKRREEEERRMKDMKDQLEIERKEREESERKMNEKIEIERRNREEEARRRMIEIEKERKEREENEKRREREKIIEEERMNQERRREEKRLEDERKKMDEERKMMEIELMRIQEEKKRIEGLKIEEMRRIEIERRGLEEEKRILAEKEKKAEEERKNWEENEKKMKEERKRIDLIRMKEEEEIRRKMIEDVRRREEKLKEREEENAKQREEERKLIIAYEKTIERTRKEQATTYKTRTYLNGDSPDIHRNGSDTPIGDAPIVRFIYDESSYSYVPHFVDQSAKKVTINEQPKIGQGATPRLNSRTETLIDDPYQPSQMIPIHRKPEDERETVGRVGVHRLPSPTRDERYQHVRGPSDLRSPGVVATPAGMSSPEMIRRDIALRKTIEDVQRESYPSGRQSRKRERNQYENLPMTDDVNGYIIPDRMRHSKSPIVMRVKMAPKSPTEVHREVPPPRPHSVHETIAVQSSPPPLYQRTPPTNEGESIHYTTVITGTKQGGPDGKTPIDYTIINRNVPTPAQRSTKSTPTTPPVLTSPPPQQSPSINPPPYINKPREMDSTDLASPRGKAPIYGIDRPANLPHEPLPPYPPPHRFPPIAQQEEYRRREEEEKDYLLRLRPLDDYQPIKEDIERGYRREEISSSKIRPQDSSTPKNGTVVVTKTTTTTTTTKKKNPLFVIFDRKRTRPLSCWEWVLPICCFCIAPIVVILIIVGLILTYALN